MRIEEVRTRSDLRRFIRVPRDLYRDLAGFRPPLDLAQRELLAPSRSPFFAHADGALFLALDGSGQPIGRITAHFDRLSPADRTHVGHFGALDTVDDPQVVAALIGAARDWHARRGRRALLGPYSYSINEEAGVMVEGQERGDMILMPWHPAWIGPHVEAAGLVPVKDLLAFSLGYAAARQWSGIEVALRARGGRIVPRPLNLRDLKGEAAILTELYNSAWQDNWGFVPLAQTELLTLLRVMWPIMRPSYGVVLEMEGRPAAFALVLPNAYELFDGFGGRLLPFNWARLIARVFTHRFRQHRLTLLGVSRGLRDTVLGTRLTLTAVTKLIAENPFASDIEMSWVLDDNVRMRRLIDSGGATVSKRYRLYGDPVEGAAS
ncbi:hypothetical protein [Phreatobacter sp.]|uniref:hypothetical protein n=1 Tax=Phreatobacter sp. TaxID=1966341 RepID=UPI003F6E4757